MNDKLMELAEKLLQIRDLKSKAESEAKEYSKEQEQIEIEMLQIMTDIEIDAFKTKTGVHFSVVKKEFKTANPERKEELYDQMKANGYDHLFTINANTLQATVKELTQENDGVMPEWLDGLINSYEKQSIRVKR